MPKGVIWRQRCEQHSAASRSTKAVVNISIHPLSPIHDFYARVRSFCIELKSTSNETHTFRLSRADIVKTIRMDGRVSACVSSHYLITYRYDNVQLDLPRLFSFYLPLVAIHYFVDSDSCKWNHRRWKIIEPWQLGSILVCRVRYCWDRSTQSAKCNEERGSFHPPFCRSIV